MRKRIKAFRLNTDGFEDADKDEALMMSLFLDFLMKDAIKNPSELVPYTQEMSHEMDELVAECNLEDSLEEIDPDIF